MVNYKTRPNILVVDEQEDITWSLAQALSDKDVNASVFTAADCKEALDKLSSATIHLLITDIKMIEANGQDLFIEIKKKFPAVSVIVMTTLPSDTHKKEGMLGEKLFFVEKPFDMNKLKQQVVKIITEKAPMDLSQAGITLSDIIQLKCLAGSTTTLKINKSNQHGALYFKDGELIHATCDKLEGEEAFFKVMDFGKAMITTSLLPKTIATTIFRPGMTLVREGINNIETTKQKAAREAEARKKAAIEYAARMKAEEEAAARKKAAEEAEAARKKAEEEAAARKKAEEEEVARKKAKEEEIARKKAEEEEAARKKAEEEAVARKKAEEEAEAARKKAEEEEAARKKAEEKEVARKKAEEEEAARKKAEALANYEKRKAQTIHAGLKDLITGLSNIQDYIAVGVLAPSGKLLIYDSTDKSLNLESLGDSFNKLFRKIMKTSSKVGFEKCRETMFSYEEKTVIMRRSGPGENIHFHFMAIMESSLNLELVDKVMDDFQTRVQKKLSQL